MLVTSALPYASGPIHIGHLVEYLQTDIWVRFQKLRGHDCLYLCASDAHGTPIMLKARDAGVEPEALVEGFRQEHQQDFADFHIEFDNYHSTHSEENRVLVEEIYARLQAKGLIESRDIEQAYDAEAGMFLPDRFMRGTCPKCGATDQYGDSCEVCGSTYDSSELVDAVSILTNTTPVLRTSEHLFFRLSQFAPMLENFIAGPVVDQAVGRKLAEWFAGGLQDWDISRDAPYFGFRIPGTEDKYFYVWLDAPVGYLASFVNLAKRRPELQFDDYFGADAQAELYHFIGKDIVYFHTLFWPAVLEGAGLRKPTRVFAHGFLMVNGQKMSKRRGTFVAARQYLDHLNPEHLRYYFASKLSAGIDDIDLNFDDFVARVNADLVGKLVNIASRCAGFINKGHGGRLGDELDEPETYAAFVTAGTGIAAHYENREFARAMREIMQLADRANQYIDERKPWVLAREGDAARVQAVCTQGLNLFRVLIAYLSPVLPAVAARAAEFLNAPLAHWDDVAQPLLRHSIKPFEPLLTRVDARDIDTMLTAVAAAHQDTAAVAAPPADADATQISIDEFQRIDLRVATVLRAEAIPEADKLLRIVVDDGSRERTIMAGIKRAYAPEILVGRQVIIVANLKPRKMRFGTSEGMILAAGDDDIFLLSPDTGAQAGMRVK
jgi:methionyl-tRNA synthetase